MWGTGEGKYLAEAAAMSLLRVRELEGKVTGSAGGLSALCL